MTPPTLSQLENLVHHLEQAYRLAGEIAEGYDPAGDPMPNIAARSIRARVGGLLPVARELEELGARLTAARQAV